eukprot:15365701-Ditylum_brightwellii.AAC.1
MSDIISFYNSFIGSTELSTCGGNIRFRLLGNFPMGSNLIGGNDNGRSRLSISEILGQVSIIIILKRGFIHVEIFKKRAFRTCVIKVSIKTLFKFVKDACMCSYNNDITSRYDNQ